MNLRITGSKRINASFKETIQKAEREFGTIKIKPIKDDGYGINMDSIEDSVERRFLN